jgi:hypothetical protein
MPRRLALVPAGSISTPTRPRRHILRFAGRELAIWATVYGAYLAVRGLTIGAPAEAIRHASDVVSIERALGVFREGDFQRLLSPVADVFSAYYMLGFGPTIATVAIWLGIKRPDVYRRLRNALLVSVSMATFAYVFFPTAPPRLAGLGIDDTVGLSAHDTGSLMGIRFNPYAAVPSMHVGWSVIVGYFGFRTARHPALRAFFVAHPLLMAVAVTATGNHFFFDCVTGALVAAATLLLLQARRTRRERLSVVPGGAGPELPVEDLDRKAA